MKTKTILALLLFAPIIASAQVQTFFSTARFATNVFLHDNTNTPVHLRIPTNAVIDAITSTNGSVTVTTNGSAINLAVDGGLVQGGNITGRWFAVGNTVGDSFFPFIGGGFGNVATGIYTVIGGGVINTARGQAAVISGGSENTAVGKFSSIVGGVKNITEEAGEFATVGGGFGNVAAGSYAFVAGGFENRAFNYSFSAGIGALATNSGSFVWSGPGDTNATFGSKGDNTFNVRSVGGVYFLAQGLYISDTNGVVHSYFSPTNSLIQGYHNISAANTNYYRITTPPANNAAAGEFGQIAYNSTNIFLYHAASGKWLRVTGTMEW